MRKILKIVIVVVILLLCYRAYNTSKVNGQSFWYNLGSTSKSFFDDGIEKGKAVASEVTEGYNTSNDSIQ
jgi:hypothetical protein